LGIIICTAATSFTIAIIRYNGTTATNIVAPPKSSLGIEQQSYRICTPAVEYSRMQRRVIANHQTRRSWIRIEHYLDETEDAIFQSSLIVVLRESSPGE
jgi:mevalonate pyrophosphate decarboxylase